MKVLVTGCAGFIGSHLTQELLDNGDQVLGIDSLAHNGKLENMFEFIHHHNFQFFPVAIQQIFGDYVRSKIYEFQADVVIHLAALNSIQKSVDSPQSVMQANVNDSYTVFDMARNFKWKRIVFASSSSVYGDHPISHRVEGQEGNVSSMYALSKVFLEKLAHVHWKSYGIEYVGLRFFNIFGPRQLSEGPYSPVLAKWVKSGQCEIFGDGTQRRDYTHVSNAVYAIDLAVNVKEPNFVVNIGCGEATSLRELSQMLGFSKADTIYREARRNEVKDSYAHLGKAIKLLKYEPITSLEEGLKGMGLWESFKHV